jgi:VanZ family protein
MAAARMNEPRRWAPSVAWAAGILIVTSLPGSALPPFAPLAGADKVVHAAMYAALGVLVARAIAQEGRRIFVVPLAVIALLAALDEWHQLWIPGRSADARDWMADVAGAAAGLTFSYMALSRRERRT